MSSFDALYHEVMLAHQRRPTRRGELPCPPARAAELRNPLCGDEVTIYVELEGDLVKAARFDAEGCAISLASASMLADDIEGRSVTELRARVDAVRAMIDAGGPAPDAPGDLAVLQAVREFPARHRCATIAWEALASALRDVQT